ncbi:hypothetical protein MAR_019009 [Mya arenaria]|uniref:Uncharacterized protein n=1 Tax=Mya arenaria TaxID=6604 RepID=A0ABY7EJT6_MYAAR|nr:hypothetical protein MAR_019009 [Mya arenaria]
MFRDYIGTETVTGNQQRLIGTAFNVDRDYPKGIKEARNTLYNLDEARRARWEGKHRKSRAITKSPNVNSKHSTSSQHKNTNSITLEQHRCEESKSAEPGRRRRDAMKGKTENLGKPKSQEQTSQSGERNTGTGNDILLCLCYNIPSGSSTEIMSEQCIFDTILNDMCYFDNVYENYMSMRLTVTYIERANKRLLLDFCKTSGLRIVNGRCCEDGEIGQFTCVKSNGSSVVDYVLCRQDMFSLFDKFVVEEPNILSDQPNILRTIVVLI